MTIPCYVSEVLSTPTSITVTSYLNGSATGDTITPSVDALGTGLSTITYTPSGTVAGDTLTLKISQTVSGTTRVTTVDVLVVDTAATIATGVWNALTSALTTASSIGKYLLDHIVGTLAAGTHNPQSGDAYARLGAPAGASVSADIAAVLALASSAATAAAAAETAAEAAQSAVDGLDVIPAAQAGNQVSGSALSLCRGTTITINLSDLGDLSDRTKLWVTGKYNVADPDSAAIFQVEETAGLLRIGGAAPVTGETATLTVTDEVAGDVTVEIGAAAAAKLRLVSDGVYDAKWRNSDGEVIATAATALSISGDVTRATS